MTADKQKYEPRFIFGVPTVFIVVVWISIWFLWPSDVLEKPGNARQSGMKIHYSRFGIDFGVMGPDILLESDAELALKDDEQVDDTLIMARHERPVRFLDRQTSADRGLRTETVALMPNAEADSKGQYFPRWGKTPLFTKGSVTEKKFFVAPHQDLAAKGFVMPELESAVLDKFNGSWQITAYIELNAEGIPEHVFLVEDSGDSKIDTIVIRELYKSRLTKPGEKTGGRVTVNWGDS